MSIRIVLAEDNYLIREGVRRLLDAVPDVDVVGTCEDVDSLLAAIEESAPDVVLTDIRMPPTSTDEGIRVADQPRRGLDREETPEALKGLAKAAFFLDEAELMLDARERAYAGYREAERMVDAARVAIALAWDYHAVRGERAVSDGWLARARRLLEGRGQTQERGWLALREASFALPGDAMVARERCAEAEVLGRELGQVDLPSWQTDIDDLDD